MKQNVRITCAVVAAVSGSVWVQADDVAGLMRVESDTNGEVTVEMPFTPFGDGTIPTFLSGTFFGDGGVGSDRLWRIALQDGATTNAVYASGEWVDPADGPASALTATQGDMLVLASGDGAPFGFWLRGRVAPECSGRTHRRQMIGLLGGISQKVSGRYQHLV